MISGAQTASTLLAELPQIAQIDAQSAESIQA
jgi:hypothetical protein